MCFSLCLSDCDVLKFYLRNMAEDVVNLLQRPDKFTSDMLRHKHTLHKCVQCIMTDCFCTNTQTMWFIGILSLSSWNKMHAQRQTLRWHSARPGQKTNKQQPQRQVYVFFFSRGGSWLTICFPICSRWHCCLPCQQRPPSSISLLCVFSSFLLWQTRCIMLSQPRHLAGHSIFVLIVQCKFSSSHSVHEGNRPPWTFSASHKPVTY